MENEAFHKSARLSAIVESSEDAIISKNLNGIIISWNRSAEIIFGFTPEEAIGKHISLIIPEYLLEEENTIISKVKKGERIEHYETIRKRKDGSLFSIALTVSPIKDENGNVIGASKIARDLSDLKQSEEKQAMLAAIIDSSDDAIVSKNLDGIITSWNNGAASMFGYKEEEAVGKHITLIIPPDLIEEEKAIIEKIRKGEKVDHFETIRVKKNGTRINVSLTVSPIKNKKDVVIGASKIARDITEKFEMERQQKLLTQKLKELNIYKDDFMAMASHELKTPLTVIKANLQLLEYKMQNDKNIEFITKTLRSVNKLSDLITGLLDVSKIQAGKLELTATAFDVLLLLNDVIENIQQATPSHKIILKEIKDKLVANADKERIEQVIINMLSTFTFVFAANIFKKYSARRGISFFLSRSGGNEMVNTFSR